MSQIYFKTTARCCILDYRDDQQSQGAGNPGAGYDTSYVMYSDDNASAAVNSSHGENGEYSTFSDKNIRHAFIRKVISNFV